MNFDDLKIFLFRLYKENHNLKLWARGSSITKCHVEQECLQIIHTTWANYAKQFQRNGGIYELLIS